VLGTVVNIAVVLFGGTVGSLLGNRLPARVQETIIRGLGLVTLVVGLQMALNTRNILIVMFSILLGGIWGEAWRLDDHLNTLGDRVEAWFKARQAARRGVSAAGTFRRYASQSDEDSALSENDRDATDLGQTDTGLRQPEPSEGPLSRASVDRSISRAFVTASLIFCIGPLATLGAVQDGLLGDANLLMIKSTLDLFSSMALSASLGPGVILASGSVLVYQGGLSLAAKLLGASLFGSVSSDMPAIVEMTAAGGVMILGIGFDLLGLRVVRVANLLPAIALAPLFVIGLTQLGFL